MKVREAKIEDFTPDPDNANKGTPRGDALLAKSIEDTGLGRSIVADAKGVIIAGNKTFEHAAAAGMKRVVVVPSDGNTLVIVQRTDLDLASDPKARQLAILDNRVGELNLDWDAEVLARQSEEFGIPLEDVGITEGEMAHLAAMAAEEANTATHENPPAANPADAYDKQSALLVICESPDVAKRLQKQLELEGHTVRSVQP